MSGIVRKITAAAIAASLTVVPTGAIAAPTAAAPAATATPANPWLALSAMTSTSSSAASAAALQDDDGPGFPPIAPLIVILGTIALAVYILTKDDDGDDLGLPLSPD